MRSSRCASQRARSDSCGYSRKSPRRSTGLRVIILTREVGTLSQCAPEHFLEHWQDATGGTIAEGSKVDAELSEDLTDPNAHGVILEDVEIALD
jgi:hydrogenase nickel incorporation protein HypA/HybF